uniref:M-phase-specific PLK1-interacting protein n=1 Tax=Oryzias sinensis TaxID=183150 RepID=A0A8C7WWV2_9TELE
MCFRFRLVPVSIRTFAQMYQGPSGRAQRSPGGPRPAGRFPSPDLRWGSPFTGSPRGFSPEFSPRFSAGSNRGHYRQDQDGSPGSYGGWSRRFAGQMPGRAHEPGVEKFFSPSMLQDPWKDLQPVTAEEAAARRTA